jgi:competence protein ComEC
LLTDLADTDKTYRYSIQPCLDSSRIAGLTVLPFTKDINNSFLLKRGNFIRFLDKSVYIAVKWTIGEALPDKPYADYFFVTGNPQVHPDEHYQYQELIVDANNSDALVDQFKAEALKHNKKINILKRNKSLIIQSDE